MPSIDSPQANRSLVVIAAACNAVVIAASFAVYGMNHQGAGAATRNTARFAVCFFLVGFAGAGLRRFFPRLPESATLIQAFVAAQLVHFVAVAALHTRFADEPLQIGLPQVALVTLGFSLVVAAGVTARAQSRFASRAHVVMLYVIWLILAADYPQHPEKWLRLVAVPVFAAMVLRHLPRGAGEKRATAAGASG